MHERASTGGVFVTQTSPLAFCSKVYYNLSIPGRLGRGVRYIETANNGSVTTGGATTIFDATGAIFASTDVGGWVRIPPTGLGNQGIHQIISFINTQQVVLLHEFAGTGSTFSIQGGLNYIIWTQGESVEIVEVDRAANTLMVRESVGYGGGSQWPNSTTVPWGCFIEAGASPTHRDDAIEGIGELTIEVDRATGLVSSNAHTDTFVPSGEMIPDEWEAVNIDRALTTWGHPTQLFAPVSLTLWGNTPVVTMELITPPCPNVLNLRGREIRISFWVQQYMIDPTADFRIEVSYDNQVTWSVGVNEAVPVSFLDIVGPAFSFTANDPTLLTITSEVPWDATNFHARLVWDLGASPAPLREMFSVLRAMVTTNVGNGVFLGTGTVPRSALETEFGDVLYAWSPQELTVAENNAIGLPSGIPGDPINIANNTQNQIDQIVEAHGYWQRFDPTTYNILLDAENLLGSYKDTEWVSASMSNLELITAAPGRLSYLQPIPRYYNANNQLVPTSDVEERDGKFFLLVGGVITTTELTQRVSAVVDETLGVVAPGIAPLAEQSTHRGNPEGLWASPQQLPNTGSALGPANQTLQYPTRLYKDGVPIEDTVDAPAPVAFWWRFSDASNIQINSPDPLLPASDAWTIDYQVEMSVYTDVIDIGTIPSDYVWLVDSAVWLRRETLEIDRQIETEVQFLTNNTAALAVRSNQDKLTGVLTADNGITTTQVDESNWSYVSSSQIRIDRAAFDAAAVYTFQYTGVTGSPTAQAKIVLEWRSNPTNNPGDFSVLGAPGAPAPAWTVVEEGFVVNRTEQFHQLRLTVYDVSDVRDIRVYGLGLRGVNLYGTPPSAPGILLP